MLTLLNESQEVHRSLCARVSLLGLLLPHKRAKELDTGEGTLCQYLHSLSIMWRGPAPHRLFLFPGITCSPKNV